MNETQFKTLAMKWLNAQPQTVAYKNHGGPMGTTGRADITCCIYGLYVDLELKVGRNQPTAIQAERGRKILAAGGAWHACWTMEDVRVVWYTASRAWKIIEQSLQSDRAG